MTLSVLAKKDNLILMDAAIAGVERGLAAFDELLPRLGEARCWIDRLASADLNAAPEVLQKMITSVRLLKDPTFTPMAAVAGSFADLIREEILRVSDADCVIVNNGGDISYCADASQGGFRVGIISSIADRRVTHRLILDAKRDIHGIATSGFGGRSLSRGIASAVSVLAKTCSLADAAATDIANHCFVEDPEIFTCPAQQIDSDTDIAGLMVVREIGSLSERTARAALECGYKRAKHLCASGMIQGAVLFVGGCFTCYPHDLELSENYAVNRRN